MKHTSNLAAWPAAPPDGRTPFPFAAGQETIGQTAAPSVAPGDHVNAIASGVRHRDGGAGVASPGAAHAEVIHREQEYDSTILADLLAMQRDHFWYRGRNRFLLYALRRFVLSESPAGPRRWIDIGCGCGGWAAELARQFDFDGGELAVADSAPQALEFASGVLPGHVGRHLVDVMNLPWRDRWDVIFLLDVIEHLPDDRGALEQVRRALAPGGTAIVTTPALGCFWSWYDERVGHQRRYRRADLLRLGRAAGLEAIDVRYFMFLLSPLVWLSRKGASRPGRDAGDPRAELAAAHRIPRPIVNRALASIFALETPLGHWLPAPWGTSLLAVLRKPRGGRLDRQ